MKGIEHGFGQSSDTDVRQMAGCLSEQELLSDHLNQAALSQKGKLGKYIA